MLKAFNRAKRLAPERASEKNCIRQRIGFMHSLGTQEHFCAFGDVRVLINTDHREPTKGERNSIAAGSTADVQNRRRLKRQ